MNSLTLCSALFLGTAVGITATQLRAEDSTADTLETAFVDGGRITIQLSAGTHRISESADKHIRVSWSVDERGAKRKVLARTDVDGSRAKINIDGPRNHFHTIIEVPRHSDLTVRLTAGDLSIDNIVGDKDIRLRAGDLSVDVGNARDYRHVDGSLWAGDIDAGPFQLATGGLFRSIEWNGDGAYELRFHLYAGDVHLYEGGPD